jgi:hypothetical protein
LRQFVDAGTAKKAPSRGYARIVFDLESSLTATVLIVLRISLHELLDMCPMNAFVGVGPHRPEFKKKQGFPFLPMRSCRDRTGPGDVDSTATPANSISGEKRTIAIKAPVTSMVRFSAD